MPFPEELRLHLPPDIEPCDGPWRFWVYSESRGRNVRHLVELDALMTKTGAPNGQCGCENFQFERFRKLRENGIPSDETRCKHIKYVRETILDLTLNREAQKAGANCEVTIFLPRPALLRDEDREAV